MAAEVEKNGSGTLPPVLNLGCGTDQATGRLDVDISPAVNPDIVHDLDDQPWPWAADSFEVVLASHVLEHVGNVTGALDEICRVLQPNGKFVWRYPIGHTRFEDPTHRHYWNWHTAEAITGTRAHGHEFGWSFQLDARDATWRIDPPSPVSYARACYKLWRYGPGPWLGQVPGLYGEVAATYRRVGDE